MASTQVDIAGMNAAQSTFQAALEQTTGSYTQMDTQIMGLQASWQGDAASIYSQAMHEWLSDFAKVNAALQRMLEQLQANTGVYGNVHSETSGQANQVRSVMGSGLANFPI